VRQKIGSGSPNTVSPMLERWFATLGKRLSGRADSARDGTVHSEAQQLPLTIVQAAQRFWEAARLEADKVQLQKTEATRRELELERSALAQQEADLQQRETSYEQARVALDEALSSSRQAVTAMEVQMHAQQEESARLLGNAEAEVRRLRKALDEAVAGKEALREKSALDLAARERSAQEAEERHLAQERRLLSELDRERVAARQASVELAKEQKTRAAEAEAARAGLRAAQQSLKQEKSSHHDAEETWSQQHQAAQIELATWRERAASAEQRAADLGVQLQRQQAHSERELERLRESQATTTAVLRQLELRPGQAVGRQRTARGKKSPD
jgi:Plasmid replication region DNA-binding N-term